MKIDAYYNLITSIKADLKTTGTVDKNNASKSADRAAELGKGFGVLLEKAFAEPDGSDAVARARQAMADGTLENQAALDNAAANILNLGI